MHLHLSFTHLLLKSFTSLQWSFMKALGLVAAAIIMIIVTGAMIDQTIVVPTATDSQDRALVSQSSRYRSRLLHSGFTHGGTETPLNFARPNVYPMRPLSKYSISAFCTCIRFSASSQTTDCGPSITSAVTSSPRCAGRQCIKRASL